VPITEIDISAAAARPTGLEELDRVLGGGLVPAVVLLVTEAGAWSTTRCSSRRWPPKTGPVLYVTGESRRPR
jgi:DNA repair protein RadA/Sms